MDVFEAIGQRYSVRHYQDRAVEQEKLDRILEAARLAPSASNRQEWRFVVVRDAAKRQALVEAACGQEFVGQAPVVIVACAKHDGRIMTCGHLAYTIDVAIGLEHIALQATEEGLGTCWIGAFHEDKAKAVCGIPMTEDIRVIQLMPLGYPADSPRPKNRLAIEEIVMYDEWKE
jgi:nitroreductase